MLLFSLTFYTVTSFDRGWGREEKRVPDSLEQAPAVQSFLSHTDKAILSFFLFLFFDGVCNKTSSPSAWYISFFSDYITCARLRGSFCMTAGFGYSRLDN